MIRFPISDLLDPQECYEYLVCVLHPNGLHCKAGHPLPPDQAPHDRERARWLTTAAESVAMCSTC